jgi:ATPase subunit of ABC transporter with duplicated ATPase domains
MRAVGRDDDLLTPRTLGAWRVVIASNLRKELAGSVLFDGVSFSVERRDRAALSGPNGAGKTTLLGSSPARRRSTAASSHSRRERAWPCTTSGHRSSAS